MLLSTSYMTCLRAKEQVLELHKYKSVVRSLAGECDETAFPVLQQSRPPNRSLAVKYGWTGMYASDHLISNLRDTSIWTYDRNYVAQDAKMR
jgi:hypothetical protein